MKATYRDYYRKPSVESEEKPRDCLLCGKKFTAMWAGNFVCIKCKQSQAWKNGGEFRRAP